jgi:hypothetical protein
MKLGRLPREAKEVYDEIVVKLRRAIRESKIQRKERVENTAASRRVIVGRVRSCIQNMRVQGLVERDGDAWRLTDKT